MLKGSFHERCRLSNFEVLLLLSSSSPWPPSLSLPSSLTILLPWHHHHHHYYYHHYNTKINSSCHESRWRHRRRWEVGWRHDKHIQCRVESSLISVQAKFKSFLLPEKVWRFDKLCPVAFHHFFFLFVIAVFFFSCVWTFLLVHGFSFKRHLGVST